MKTCLRQGFYILLLSTIACDVYSQIQSTDSINVQLLFREAYNALSQRNAQLAEKLTDSIIENYPHHLLKELNVDFDIYTLGINARQLQSKDEEVRHMWHFLKSLYQKEEPIGYEGLARLHLLRAGWYNNELAIDSIQRYLTQANTYLEFTPKSSHAYIQYYYQKGRLAYNNFDFKSQAQYLITGLQHLEKHFPDNHIARISFCNAIGISYRNLGQFDKAQHYLNLGLQNPASSFSELAMQASILNNLGLTYSDLGQFDDCITCIEKAVTFYHDNISPSYDELGSGYDNLGRCYLKNKREKEALLYFEKALKFMEEHLPKNHRDFVLPYLSFAEYYAQKKKYDEAIQYLTLAKNHILSAGWSRDDPVGNYIIEDPLDIFNLSIKLYKKKFDTSNDYEDLKLAIEAMKDFAATTAYVISQYDDIASIQGYFNRYTTTYDIGLECLYAQWKNNSSKNIVHDAFAWLEKYKSLELKFAFRRSRVTLPKQYLSLERQKKKLQDSLNYLISIADNSIENNDHSNVLSRVKLGLYEWKSFVRDEHPAYYNLLYGLNLDQANLDKSLNPDETLILHKASSNALFTLLINSNHATIHRSSLDYSISELIRTYNNSIIQFGTTHKYNEKEALESLQTYRLAGRSLYNTFLAPVANQLTSNLVFIPDEEIGQFTYAALLTDTVSNRTAIRTFPFLIKKHAISTSPAVALLYEMKEKNVQNSRSAICFAPSFTPTDGPLPLIHNTLECEQVAQILNGKIIKDQAATFHTFMKTAPKFSILHLATHAKSDTTEGDNSYLLFSPDTASNMALFSSRIYSMELNADLVALSACETGIGELRKGEGLISLSRAFAFAGVKSVLHSLWSINDKRTTEFIPSFYRHIKQYQSKPKALQQASLDYIKNSTTIEAHPYYWSGFLISGDPSPISTKKNSKTVLFKVILGVLILFFLLFFRKKLKLLGT